MPEQNSKVGKTARLILKMGGTTREFEFENDRISIGRVPENNISISFDKRASRYHTEVYKKGESYFLKDLESRNGTFINGKPVKDEIQIFTGDIITAGETDIRFEIGAAEEAYCGTMLLDQEEAKKMFAQQQAMTEDVEEPVWVVYAYWFVIIAIIVIIGWAIMNMP